MLAEKIYIAILIVIYIGHNTIYIYIALYSHTHIYCSDKFFATPAKKKQDVFAGQQGAIKTYLTIGDKLFIPGLIHYL